MQIYLQRTQVGMGSLRADRVAVVLILTQSSFTHRVLLHISFQEDPKWIKRLLRVSTRISSYVKAEFGANK